MVVVGEREKIVTLGSSHMTVTFMLVENYKSF